MKQSLASRRVAITGRMASLAREEAIALIAELGGEYAPSVTRSTTHLVVGREGWPLERDGKLTRKLEAARALQAAGSQLAILPEEEFLALAGLEAGGTGLPRHYTTGQLARILGVSGGSIRAWVRLGLIQPARIEHRLCYFDFAQVASAKSLNELVRSGVTAAQIRASLVQLKPFLTDAEQPLRQLSVLEGKSRLIAAIDGGALVDRGGQRYFDFVRGKGREPIAMPPRSRSVDDWFDEALEHEDAGRWPEAERAYRQALLEGGPEAELCFNLGNVLYASGQKAQAAERFRQAIELDLDYVEAWNNLGNVLSDLGEHAGALAAYDRALELAPSYADAHYNLASALREMGRREEARSHWRAYLEADPHSASAREVRAYLREP